MSELIQNPWDWEVHPPKLYPAYKSTVLRAPSQPLVIIPQALSNPNGPLFGTYELGEFDHDLTINSRVNGDPQGERIIVHGRVTDEKGHGIHHTLLEIWQANAAGRYVHKIDKHAAPLDPNFLGSGRCRTDKDGYYEFYSIKPGAYPWGNHYNAWRPNHIHFSLFGPNITTRLVTQMYFPGDPLLSYDPIFKSIPEKGRPLVIASFDLERTEPEFALAYRFDIVLRGEFTTPFEN